MKWDAYQIYDPGVFGPLDSRIQELGRLLGADGLELG
jgi:hypothetical protein